MSQVSVRQARDSLSQLIKAAQAGEDIVISNHGQPVARLVPIEGLRGAELAQWLREHQAAGVHDRTKAAIDEAMETERESWE